jgi:hypothetical protein
MGIKMRCTKVEFSDGGAGLTAHFAAPRVLSRGVAAAVDCNSRLEIIRAPLAQNYEPVYVAGREYDIEISIVPVDAVF